ncbi:MAG: DinB family protein [Bacteroidetes bacterium]|nr:DinB family protein [Bacteroidota bacterium]MBU1374260.1 DinB family protein [Bacteroidota bacterium]MBU1485285.1 DinB family protein [Bacteroidota bacterium]MBU1759842.1 DinB family protein [Bacteroidota bacterium]MBU2046012.1 DinB family protein [Bacteroidota bacterium]
MLSELLVKELEQESASSFKMLVLVPGDQLNWQPHPKSMTLGKLAGHVTEIHSWIKFCIEREVMDFGIEKWEPITADNGEGFAQQAKELTKESMDALKNSDDDTFLNKRWAMKYNGQMIMDFTKYEAVRHSLSQMIHHRAQLGVFLRLLDIPIPGTYGPSADEMEM